jgi:ribulose-phosphate 3-epimerase
MAGGIKIAPSLLAADFGNLERDLRACEEAGVDYIHLDVMDGHFVPNISFGPVVIEAIRKRTTLTLDVHLMITDPGTYLKAFADSGADILTVHQEIPACATKDGMSRLLTDIRKAGMKAGMSIRPKTPAETLFGHLDAIDLALVMSVEPGFGGQAFMPSVLPKATALENEIARQGLSTEIEIDGGIGVQNAAEAVRAGVRVLVAGSSTFKEGKVAENVAALRAAAEKGAGGRSDHRG